MVRTRLSTWFLLLLFVLCAGVALAQDEALPNEVEVAIGIFSGRPDPVLTLEKSEIGEYQRLLAQFTDRGIKEDKPIHIFSYFGGLRITEYGPGHEPLSIHDLYGRRLLNPPIPDASGQAIYTSRAIVSDNSLELYLVDLALKKGVIDDEVHRWIIRAIGERK
jgi:hypothetical protein